MSQKPSNTSAQFKELFAEDTHVYGWGERLLELSEKAIRVRLSEKHSRTSELRSVAA